MATDGCGATLGVTFNEISTVPAGGTGGTGAVVLETVGTKTFTCWDEVAEMAPLTSVAFT